MIDSLLSCLEALTGPDRKIDAEIALDNGWRQLSHDLWRKGDEVSDRPPEFTKYIDVVRTTLLSDETPWIAQTSPQGGFQAYVWDEEGESKATPAIALLIAFYKMKEESKS